MSARLLESLEASDRGIEAVVPLDWASIGIGPGARGHERSAVLHALRYGSNVIDLGPTTVGAQSDRAVRAALDDATLELGAGREDWRVVVHGGYLPEPAGNFGRQVELLHERYVARRLFDWGDLALGRHCLTPAFLEASLEQRLLDTLLERFDLYLLDAPHDQLAVVTRDGLRARLAAAFEWLESACQLGVIGEFGVADLGPLEIEDLVQLAREVGGADHHFRAVQLPISVGRIEAVAAASQVLGSARAPAFRVAAELGLKVLARGVLDGGRAEYDLEIEARRALGSVKSDHQVGLQWVRSLPGVTTAIVGMSRACHIEENLQLLEIAKASPEVALAFLEGGEAE